MGVVLEILSLIILYRPKIVWKDLALFTFGQATIFQFWTPDSLRGFGCGTPNGSLWTVCVTVQFYIVIWLLRRVLQHKRPAFHLAVFVCSAALSCGTAQLDGLIPELLFKLYKQTVIPYFWLFYLGVLFSEYRNKCVPFLKKYWYLFLAGMIAEQFISFDLNCFYSFFHSIFMCLAALALACAFPRLNIRTDITYGLYVYHMIVVNIFIELGLVEKWIYFIFTVWLSILLAAISRVMTKKIFLIERTHKRC